MSFLFVLGGCSTLSRREAAEEAQKSLPYIPPGDFYTVEPLAGAAEIAATLRPTGQGLHSWKDLAPALAASRAYVASREAGQVAVAHGTLAVTWGEIEASLALLQELLPRLDTEPDLLAAKFRWIGLTDGAEFSGYYEPVMNASRTRKPGYAYPIYRLPPDLRQADLGAFKAEYIGQRLMYRLHKGVPVPYYSRAEIDGKGALRGRGLELAWLADPLDAYFLQVQGSGRLRFEDGKEVPVAYAGTNGRPYLSIGRHLGDLGLIPPGEVSMQSIRAWLTAHPDEMEKTLFRNERYVFFRWGGNDGSPVGGMGRAITPWVTLAVDKSTYPLGAALAFAVDLPEASPGEDGVPPHGMTTRTLHGIGFAQDTGGAIRGRRVDLFCGRGEAAAFTAGHLNGPGQVWLLLPRTDAPAQDAL